MGLHYNNYQFLLKNTWFYFNWYNNIVSYFPYSASALYLHLVKVAHTYQDEIIWRNFLHPTVMFKEASHVTSSWSFWLCKVLYLNQGCSTYLNEYIWNQRSILKPLMSRYHSTKKSTYFHLKRCINTSSLLIWENSLCIWVIFNKSFESTYL